MSDPIDKTDDDDWWRERLAAPAATGVAGGRVTLKASGRAVSELLEEIATGLEDDGPRPAPVGLDIERRAPIAYGAELVRRVNLRPGSPELDSIMLDDRVEAHPERCGGEPVITGTRVMLHVPLGALAAGNSVDDVLGNYPSITRKDLGAAVRYAAELAERVNLAPF